MKDPHTMVHKGYGFISFVNKLEAETAIAQMNGQWLGTRKIRTNWATRKVQPGGAEILTSVGGVGGSQSNFFVVVSISLIFNFKQLISIAFSEYAHKLDYNEVWNRSSDTNTTVYCGGINNLTEDVIRSTFGMYGQITGIHPFPDRGYSFVRFATKEAACSAICGVHGMEVNGGIAKCSWGKENIDITSGSAPSQSVMSSMSSSLYGNANTSNSAALAQNVNSLQAAASQLGSNAWASATGSQNSNWAAANYQWAAAAGYPQNTMNYWQGYSGYQNAMMQQGWGVMPATGTAGANAQYPMGQYPQGANGKS